MFRMLSAIRRDDSTKPGQTSFLSAALSPFGDSKHWRSKSARAKTERSKADNHDEAFTKTATKSPAPSKAQDQGNRVLVKRKPLSNSHDLAAASRSKGKETLCTNSLVATFNIDRLNRASFGPTQSATKLGHAKSSRPNRWSQPPAGHEVSIELEGSSVSKKFHKRASLAGDSFLAELEGCPVPLFSLQEALQLSPPRDSKVETSTLKTERRDELSPILFTFTSFDGEYAQDEIPQPLKVKDVQSKHRSFPGYSNGLLSIANDVSQSNQHPVTQTINCWSDGASKLFRSNTFCASAKGSVFSFSDSVCFTAKPNIDQMQEMDSVPGARIDDIELDWFNHPRTPPELPSCSRFSIDSPLVTRFIEHEDGELITRTGSLTEELYGLSCCNSRDESFEQDMVSERTELYNFIERAATWERRMSPYLGVRTMFKNTEDLRFFFEEMDERDRMLGLRKSLGIVENDIDMSKIWTPQTEQFMKNTCLSIPVEREQADIEHGAGPLFTNPWVQMSLDVKSPMTTPKLQALRDYADYEYPLEIADQAPRLEVSEQDVYDTESEYASDEEEVEGFIPAAIYDGSLWDDEIEPDAYYSMRALAARHNRKLVCIQLFRLCLAARARIE